MDEKQKETIEKSMDSLIDEFFVDSAPEKKAEESSEESVEKGKNTLAEGGYLYPAEKRTTQSSLMKEGSDAGPAKETADEGEQPKKAKKDKEGDGGRPKDVQDVPDTDEDGKRAKGYDHIQQENKKTPDISPKGTMVKSLSEEEYAEYQALKKAKEEEEKEEALKKAREEQSDLIKSAVSEATSGLKSENEELRKSLQETQDLIKAMASKPQRRKSVDNIQAIEKSFGEGAEGEGEKKPEHFSKSEMMDCAEELVKSGKLTVEQAIELDDTGYIFDNNARTVLESELRKKK